MRDEQGALVGVVGGDFALGALSHMINEVDMGGHGYAYLVSGAGKILIHPRAALNGKPLSGSRHRPAAADGSPCPRTCRRAGAPP